MNYEEAEPILRLIEDIRKEERFDKKISDTLLLIDSCSEDIQENNEIIILLKYLEKMENNKEFMRSVKRHNKILQNQEDALLYYGQDYTGDTDYYYQQTLEDEFIQIDKKIRRILAIILKSLINETIMIE